MRIALLLVASAALPVGCRREDPPTPPPAAQTASAPEASPGAKRDDLTDVEKAQLIKENRKRAQDLRVKYRASGGTEFKLLEEYADLHRQNTEIAPTTCPRCWAEYGEALSMLGWKYWNDEQEVLDQMAKTGAEQSVEKKKEAAALRAKWEDSFTRSNKAYETHFRSQDVAMVHPYSYERVMRHWEILGNYERALFCLEKCLEAYPRLQGGLDDPTRQKFEKLRRIYKQEIQKQEEGKAKGE